MTRSVPQRRVLLFVPCSIALTLGLAALYLATPDEAAHDPPTAPSAKSNRRTRQPDPEAAGGFQAVVRDRPDSPTTGPNRRVLVEIRWEAQEVTWTDLAPLRLPDPPEGLAEFAEGILWQLYFATTWEKRKLDVDFVSKGDERQEDYDRAEKAIQKGIKTLYGVETRVRVAPAE